MAAFVLVISLAVVALAGCNPQPQASDGPQATATSPSPTASVSATAAVATLGPESAPLVIPAPADLSRRPVIALYQKDPWAMVLGAEIPSLVIYADGTVLRAAPSPPRLVEGRITRIPTGDLEALLAAEPAHSSTTMATDQPTVTILVDTPKGWLVRSVYGLNGEGRPTFSRSATPPSPAFLDALATLRELKVVGARDYVPEQIEIMLWGYEHSPVAPAPWPASIPAPPPRAPPPHGVIHHVVAGSLLGDFDRFRATLGSRQAVAFAGHKWSVSRRVLVPADAYLRKVRADTWRVYAEAVNQRRAKRPTR